MNRGTITYYHDLPLYSEEWHINIDINRYKYKKYIFCNDSNSYWCIQ